MSNDLKQSLRNLQDELTDAEAEYDMLLQSGWRQSQSDPSFRQNCAHYKRIIQNLKRRMEQLKLALHSS